MILVFLSSMVTEGKIFSMQASLNILFFLETLNIYVVYY